MDLVLQLMCGSTMQAPTWETVEGGQEGRQPCAAVQGPPVPGDHLLLKGCMLLRNSRACSMLLRRMCAGASACLAGPAGHILPAQDAHTAGAHRPCNKTCLFGSLERCALRNATAMK